ncbi:MAG: glutamine synthetase beta-grasp domain-containing protein, partial [Aeromicrobium sp.]
MFGNADELFKYIKDEGVEYLDVRFTDLPGIQQQVTLPASTFDADMVSSGVAFDGSSIRGFQTIDQSDMVLFPDVGTAYLDPFKARKTIAMEFFVHDPITGEAYSRDPRNIARKAEAYLATTGIGDTAFFAPEAEFYIFDRVNFGTSANKSFYEIQSSEAAWSTGDDVADNRGYQVRYKGGYFPVAPTDKTADLRNDMMSNLTDAGLILERGHHEVGTSGQGEINYRFDTLLKAADDVMKFKYIVRNTAWANDKTVTFMP